MITGIGSVGFTRATDVRSDQPARQVTSGAPVPSTDVATDKDTNGVSASPAAALAAQGAPVDTDKVATIKAGIANGSYKADPQAIAKAMIAQDLTVR